MPAPCRKWMNQIYCHKWEESFTTWWATNTGYCTRRTTSDQVLLYQENYFRSGTAVLGKLLQIRYCCTRRTTSDQVLLYQENYFRSGADMLVTLLPIRQISPAGRSMSLIKHGQLSGWITVWISCRRNDKEASGVRHKARLVVVPRCSGGGSVASLLLGRDVEWPRDCRAPAVWD